MVPQKVVSQQLPFNQFKWLNGRHAPFSDFLPARQGLFPTIDKDTLFGDEQRMVAQGFFLNALDLNHKGAAPL